MRVSDKGLIELVCSEGVVPYPYRDSVGVWTFGVGHTKGAGLPDPALMTKGVAAPMHVVLDVFRTDLKKYEDAVSRAVKVPLKQHEFDALVHWHYNTGAIATATLTKKLNAGDRQGAAAQFLVWDKPAELKPRREKERDLFLDGIYSNDGYALVYAADKNGKLGRATRQKVSDLLGTGELPEKITSPVPVAVPDTPDTPPVPAPVNPPGFLARFWTALRKRLAA
jgi:lysozyme